MAAPRVRVTLRLHSDPDWGGKLRQSPSIRFRALFTRPAFASELRWEVILLPPESARPTRALVTRTCARRGANKQGRKGSGARPRWEIRCKLCWVKSRLGGVGARKAADPAARQAGTGQWALRAETPVRLPAPPGGQGGHAGSRNNASSRAGPRGSWTSAAPGCAAVPSLKQD